MRLYGAMTLEAYLVKHGLTFSEFARRVETHPEQIRRYVKAGRIPRPKTMALITEVTGGEVTATDFYERA